MGNLDESAVGADLARGTAQTLRGVGEFSATCLPASAQLPATGSDIAATAASQVAPGGHPPRYEYPKVFAAIER
jgi:hypothetical protein